MTPEQFRRAQSSLDLSTARLAAELEVTPRAVQQYRQGNRPIPGLVAKYLRKMVEAKLILG